MSDVETDHGLDTGCVQQRVHGWIQRIVGAANPMTHLLQQTGEGRHPRSPNGYEVNVESLFGHGCSIKRMAQYSIGAKPIGVRTKRMWSPALAEVEGGCSMGSQSPPLRSAHP